MKRLYPAATIAAASLALLMSLAGCGLASEQSSIATAKALIGKHDLTAATIQLKSTLSDHPTSAEARYLLGATLLDMGDLVAAELELRKAKELQFEPAQWAPALAKTLLLRYKFKQVIEEFGTVKLPAADAQANLNVSVAAALAVDGQVERATALIGSTLQALPEHAPTLMLKARLLARPGTLTDAVALLNAVVSRDPANAEAWQLLGDLQLYGSRDPAQASVAYGKVLALRPADAAAHASLIFVHLVASDLAAARKQLEAMNKVLPGHPQTKFLAARIAFLSGDPTRSRELVQQLLRVSPDSVALLEFAGAVELQLNSPLQAETHLSKALAKTPDLPSVRRLLADTYLRTGKPAKALEVLRPNIDRTAPDVLSLNLAGEAHLLSGDIAKAEAFFQQASKLAPSDPKAKTALALTLLAKGQAESAFTELRALAASATDTLPDMALISALLRRQKLDEALLAIDGLERKQPNKPTAANLRGRVQLARRDLPTARKSFERALEVDPAFLPAIASLAVIDVAEGKLAQAEKRYAELLQLDPKNAQAYLALAQLKTRSGGSKDEISQLIDKAVQANPADPAPRLALVHHALSQRDMKSAMAAAQAGVAAMPENTDMLDALGSMQLVTGEPNQAIMTFNKVVTLQPKVVKFQLRLADAYLQGKDPLAAERSFKRALELAPSDLGAQRGLIALSVRAKQPERALEVARTIQRQRPTDSIGHQIEGDVQAEFKNIDAAIKAYRTGLEKPNPGRLAERLYTTLASAKGQPEAVRFGDEWSRRHPGNSEFQVFLGNSAIARADLPAAERYFADIIKTNPQHGLALNNLAWVKAKQGKPGAVALAEQAVKFSPDNPAAVDTLAFALAADNQLPKAIETAKGLLVRAPDDPVYRLNLARIYIRAGDKASAKGELERLVPLGTKFPLQSEVSDLLKSLQ